MPVLGQASIPHFAMSKEVLHDVEGVFDEGPYRRLGLLHRLACFLLRPRLARIGMHLRLRSVQQFCSLDDVGYVGRTHHHGMHQRAFTQQQSARGEVGVDGGEEAFAQIVHLQPVAEVQKSGGVGHTLGGEINAGKVA